MIEIEGKKYIKVKPESILDNGTPSCSGCAFVRHKYWPGCPDPAGNKGYPD